MTITPSELNAVAPFTPTPRELAQAIRAGFEGRRYLASVAFGPARAASVVTGSRKALVTQAEVAAYPAVARPGPLAAVIRGLRRIVRAFIRPWLAVQTDYNRIVNEILEIHGAEIAVLSSRLDRCHVELDRLRSEMDLITRRLEDSPAGFAATREND